MQETGWQGGRMVDSFPGLLPSCLPQIFLGNAQAKLQVRRVDLIQVPRETLLIPDARRAKSICGSDLGYG
jgi:hypothetical protein